MAVRRPSLVAGMALTIVLLGTIVRETMDLAQAGLLAAAALIVYVASQVVALPRTGKIILGAGLVVGISIVLQIDDTVARTIEALRTACYYATMFTAVGFLRTAAEGSRMIRRCGQQLIAQPPGRRYAALTIGGNLFGLILSFGSLQLLGTMVLRTNTLAAAGGNERIRSVRERRMLLAVLRGFSMSPAWSPLSVTLALSLSLTPGAAWQQVLPIAFTTAVLMLAFGWLYDRLTAPRLQAPPPTMHSDENWSVQLRLIGLVAVIFLTAFTVEGITDLRLIVAVIVTVPVIATGWILAQGLFMGVRRALARTARRLWRQTVVVYPTYRMEITILVSAAFAGSMIATVLPTDRIAGLLLSGALPTVMIPVAVVWLVVLGGQVGLNPIITVIVVGTAMPAPDVLGIPPYMLAAAYMAGWGLCIGASPFTLTTLIIARMSGRTGREVGHDWNGRFTILGLIAVSVWMVGLTMALMP